MNDKQEIDASSAISQRKQERVAGERGAFKHSSNSLLPSGGKLFLLTILLCALALTSVFLWKIWQTNHQQVEGKSITGLVRNILPTLKVIAPTPPLEPRVTNEPNTSTPPVSGNDIHTSDAQDNIRQRRLSPNLKSNKDDSGVSNEPVSLQASEQRPAERYNNDLQQRLEPMRLDAAAAGIITDPNYLLTQGTIIDCQLETRLITTQPGMAMCYTTRNIYSTNGRVVLIDRGSKIIGHYQGGMQQGQARIFVTWSRVETPKGVVINLDSPASGELGESGVGGVVDNHFFERFSSSVMMSLIGDFSQYAANRGRNDSRTTIQFSNTTSGMQQAAVEALKNSINIPPTLYKNHGERVSIFVARDLDFRGVYELRAE